MELEEGNHKLLIDVGGLSYTLSLLDPSTIRAEPRVPQLDLPAKVVLNGADLRRAVKAAEKISDHMLMGVSGDTFFMEAKGDTDKVSPFASIKKVSPETPMSIWSLIFSAAFTARLRSAPFRTTLAGRSSWGTLGSARIVAVSYTHLTL